VPRFHTLVQPLCSYGFERSVLELPDVDPEPEVLPEPVAPVLPVAPDVPLVPDVLPVAPVVLVLSVEELVVDGEVAEVSEEVPVPMSVLPRVVSRLHPAVPMPRASTATAATPVSFS
jgi:hypothetical protein